MRASYMLPSGTYNLILSEEDLLRLLSKGRISVLVSHDVPCVTGRAVYNGEKNEMTTLDKKDVYNDLRFYLHEPVADMSDGLCNVQFLNIIIEKEVTK